MPDETTQVPTPESVQQPVTPETQPGQQSEDNTAGNTDEIRMTPGQLKQRLDRAAQSAVNQLLERFGIESPEQGAELFEAEKKRRDAEMSDLERAVAEAEAYKRATAEAKAEVEALKQARLDDKRDTALLTQLAKAHDPQTTLTVLKSKHADRVNELMKDGELDTKAVEKLIADFTAGNAYLFKSGSPGSPSNSDGRVPPPDKAAREQARSNSITRARRNV